MNSTLPSVTCRSVVLCTAVTGLLACSRPAEAPLPFADLAPSVRYVGSEACTPCHREIAEANARSEMGRSMSKLEPENIIEKFAQRRPVYDPEMNYYYEMLERSGKYFQREYRGTDNTLHGVSSTDHWICSDGSKASINMVLRGSIVLPKVCSASLTRSQTCT